VRGLEYRENRYGRVGKGVKELSDNNINIGGKKGGGGEDFGFKNMQPTDRSQQHDDNDMINTEQLI
jgi:hypothetical protein